MNPFHDNPPPPPDAAAVVADLVQARIKVPPIAYAPVLLYWLFAQGLLELALTLTADPDETIAFAPVDVGEDGDVAPCPTPGCGERADVDCTPPRGWVYAHVGGSPQPARMFCSGYCAAGGIAVAEVELGGETP